MERRGTATQTATHGDHIYGSLRDDGQGPYDHLVPDLTLFEIVGLAVPGLFLCVFVLWVVGVIRTFRQRRVLRYIDRFRAEELTGRVRQLKVRRYEEQAIQLAQVELGMPAKAARSWVKSI